MTEEETEEEPKFNGSRTDMFGRISYYKYGLLHREGAPAVTFPSGSKYWYFEGEPHREDGPASIDQDGNKHWMINGQLHRHNGPAVEYVNGKFEYWLNGESYEHKEWLKRTWESLTPEEKKEQIFNLGD